MNTKEKIIEMIRSLDEKNNKDKTFLKQLTIIISNHLKRKGRR